jgi:hypothetical protein
MPVVVDYSEATVGAEVGRVSASRPAIGMGYRRTGSRFPLVNYLPVAPRCRCRPWHLLFSIAPKVSLSCTHR